MVVSARSEIAVSRDPGEITLHADGWRAEEREMRIYGWPVPKQCVCPSYRFIVLQIIAVAQEHSRFSEHAYCKAGAEHPEAPLQMINGYHPRFLAVRPRAN
jgi:hypothetical protein